MLRRLGLQRALSGRVLYFLSVHSAPNSANSHVSLWLFTVHTLADRLVEFRCRAAQIINAENGAGIGINQVVVAGIDRSGHLHFAFCQQRADTPKATRTVTSTVAGSLGGRVPRRSNQCRQIPEAHTIRIALRTISRCSGTLRLTLVSCIA